MKYQGRLDASLIGETVKVNTWAGGYRIIKVDNFEVKGKNDQDVISGIIIRPLIEAGNGAWAYTDQIMGVGGYQ